ncbi:conserved hypothetical protein [Syntrophobacter sp. SbD1]|nr:conserved hypothetical protein [Syntrophobacter sp. SbD1]
MKTQEGKKIVTVHPYTRKVDGKTEHVPAHKRSTPVPPCKKN